MAKLDTEQYWNAKAEASVHDPLAAVCIGEPARDRCIDRVQRRLVGLALAHIARRSGPLVGAALDMGCGTGRWAAKVRALGLGYHGIDISAAMVAIARREHPEARFDKFDGETIPAGNAAFALVLSLAVLHHNDYPRQDALIAELARVLAPGGALITLEGLGPRAENGDGVLHYRPAADWQAALEARGLRLEWQRAARYFALEHISTSVLTRAGLRRIAGPAVSRPMLAAGAWIDPYLTASRPGRLHDRWLAVWRKR